MGFTIQDIDITKIKSDVILNSLGTSSQVKVFGKLCKNIVKAAGDELKKEIYSWEKKAKPGCVFLTKGYNLPSSNIVHIVTPFYKQDPELYGLEYAYKVALMSAYKKGWKNIAIPIIGTGANGYPHAIVYKMLANLLRAFTSIYKGFNVVLCIPEINDNLEVAADKDIKKTIDKHYKELENYEGREFYYNENCSKYFEREDVEEFLEFQPAFFERSFFREKLEEGHPLPGSLNNCSILNPNVLDMGVRPTKLDFTKVSPLTLTNYIDNYIEKRYSSDSDRKYVKKFVNTYVSGDEFSTSLRAKHNNVKKRTSIPVSMLMRYILALRMTQEEANELLLFCGKTFSPICNADKYYKDIINGGDYDQDSINSLCISARITPIFGYTETVRSLPNKGKYNYM